MAGVSKRFALEGELVTLILNGGKELASIGSGSGISRSSPSGGCSAFALVLAVLQDDHRAVERPHLVADIAAILAGLNGAGDAHDSAVGDNLGQPLSALPEHGHVDDGLFLVIGLVLAVGAVDQVEDLLSRHVRLQSEGEEGNAAATGLQAIGDIGTAAHSAGHGGVVNHAVLAGISSGDHSDVVADGGVNAVLPAAAVHDVVDIDDQPLGRSTVLPIVVLHLHGAGHDHPAALDQDLGHLLSQVAEQVQIDELILLQAILADDAVGLALLVGAVGPGQQALDGAADPDGDAQKRLLVRSLLVEVGGGGGDIALQHNGVGNILDSLADLGDLVGRTTGSGSGVSVVRHGKILLHYSCIFPLIVRMSSYYANSKKAIPVDGYKFANF